MSRFPVAAGLAKACPVAQELPAYRLQEAWFGELGLEPDVNWIAVTLEAGCARRDIHLD